MQKPNSGNFPTDLLAEMDAVAVPRALKAGEVVLEHGATIRYVPIVKSGALRIMRADAEGGELLLYYIEAGEACAATMSSWIGRQFSGVQARAEVDSEVLLIPIEKIDEWMGRFPAWRRFVLQTFQERFDELLEVVDTVAFLNLEERLMANLGEKTQLRKSTILKVTHQDLATELNSSRVVISRLLKVLEGRGVLQLRRNEIELREGLNFKL